MAQNVAKILARTKKTKDVVLVILNRTSQAGVVDAAVATP